MHRGVALGLCLAAGFAVSGLLELRDRMPARTAASARLVNAAQAAEPASTPTLEQLCDGRLRLVDLGWPLNKDNAYWPGKNYRPFELETLATLEKDGVLSKAFCMPEHLGTHLDAPSHFEAAGISVDQLRPEQLIAPGVSIDVSGPASADADFRLRLEDVLQWEAAHGRIPPDAVVLLYTGWSRHWDHKERYQGSDVMGRLHFPGFSGAAVRFLLRERDIRGIGIDTLSVDYGLSRDFEVHHLLGKAGRYGLENVAHLDQLPPRDFFLLIAPIKIETGSGGPTRIFAIVP